MELAVGGCSVLSSACAFVESHRSVLMTALIVLAFVPLVEPAMVSVVNIGILNEFWNLWRVTSVFMSITLCYFSVRRDWFFYICLMFFVAILTSTILAGGDAMIWVYQWLPLLGAVALAKMTYARYLKELLSAVLIVSFAYTLLNFASMIAVPRGFLDGSGTFFFMGNRNSAYWFLLPAMMSSVLLDALQGKRFSFRSAVVEVVSFAEMVLLGSAASLVAFALMALCYILVQKKPLRRFLNGVTYVGLTLFASIALIGFRVHEVFGFVVQGIFHKSMTLSSRTYVWDKVMELLDRKHALFGYGLSGYKELQINGITYSHAHNEYLSFLFFGGLIALCLFLVLLVLALRELAHGSSSYLSAVLALSVGALSVIGIVEQVTSVALFLFLALCYYVPRCRVGEEVDTIE